MAQAVLVASSKVITRRTLRRLLIPELNSEVEKQKRSIFDDIILKKLGDFIRAPEKPIKDYVPYSDDVDPDSVSLPKDNDPINKDGTSVYIIASNRFTISIHTLADDFCILKLLPLLQI